MSSKITLSLMAALALIVGLLCGSQTKAQERGGQRGGGRGAQSEPPLWLPDEDFVHWPLPEGDQRYAKIDGYKIKSYINDITAFSRRSRDEGNQFWAGSLARLTTR